MSLFKKPKDFNIPFEKEQVINDIKEMIKAYFPQLIILQHVPGFDIVLIRTTMWDVQIRRGKLNYENILPRKLHQIFVISVIENVEDLATVGYDETAKDWWTEHLIVNSVPIVRRFLEKIIND